MYSLAKKRSSFCLIGAIGMTSMLFLMLLQFSNLALVLPLANAGAANNNHLGLGGTQSIPKDSITPPNQDYPLPSNAMSGSDIPKNLITGPPCVSVSGCPTITGTNKDDIIYGVSLTDASIYGLKGNDYI